MNLSNRMVDFNLNKNINRNNLSRNTYINKKIFNILYLLIDLFTGIYKLKV